MAENTGISWTDSTWTPIRAKVRPDAPDICRDRGWTDLLPIVERTVGRLGPHCEKVSPGCAHCYSETNNGRYLPFNGTGLPFDKRSRALIDAVIDENILTQPLRWRKPRRIFVCSQTDLFGEWVPDHLIDQVFAVMALCPQHQFQVLTKRAERLEEYLAAGFVSNRIFEAMQVVTPDTGVWGWPGLREALRNVWLGVSVENQEQAERRIPHLLRTPAAIRFLSVEPMLGPVDLPPEFLALGRKAWVIVGGESGKHARPMHPAWVRSIERQCEAAWVPFFFKQWGEWAPQYQPGAVMTGANVSITTGKYASRECRDPCWADVVRVGKHAAGNLLDGKKYEEFPEVIR